MTHRQRILADRLIATPAAFVFNALARILGQLLRRDHSVTTENVRNIVVAKLIGMGSILQATPLLKALKQQYPHAKLIFLTLRSNRALLERLTSVDEIIVLDDRNVFVLGVSTLRAIATLISRRGDLYFDLEVYSAFASILALCVITRNRIGFYRKSAAFKEGIYTHLVYFNTRMPVRQLYLQLGRVVGVPASQSEITGPLRVDPADSSAVRRILSESTEWTPEDPYIVVNPNASELLLERRWPVDKAVEAIERLASFGYCVALTGATGERPFVQSILESLPQDRRSRVVNTAGQLTLGELLALLEGAACVLTNDTGPMHMAIALRRPTVCLFGPVSPEHYGYNLASVEIFYTRVFCSPCVHEVDVPPCDGDNICMQRIEPQPVVEAVQRLMRGEFTERELPMRRRIDTLPLIVDGDEGRPLGVIARASLKWRKG
jgi:ADP-heptose:LPS heptosyltransferase